ALIVVSLDRAVSINQTSEKSSMEVVRGTLKSRAQLFGVYRGAVLSSELSKTHGRNGGIVVAIVRLDFSVGANADVLLHICQGTLCHIQLAVAPEAKMNAACLGVLAITHHLAQQPSLC